MGQENCTITKGRWTQLKESERYKIEALYHRGLTAAEIGKSLEPNRDRRTIERELARGMTKQRNSDWTEKMVYLADAGQRVRNENASNKGRGLKIGHDHALARYIEQKVGAEKWSPSAAIGAIRAEGLQFMVTLCAKTVYNMIDRGDFLCIGNKDLPAKRNTRKRIYKRVRRVALNNTTGRSIEERPLGADSRMEYGHWEMDCVVGPGKACLLVLTERKYREEKIFKLESRTQSCVVEAINRLERQHGEDFKERFKSFTMDNGSEFLDMSLLELSVLKPSEKRTTCYYSHPYSAWERGSNENQNKLVRRFVPKGTDIGKLTEQDVEHIETWMNNYPRRMFGYKTPAQMAA